jgi:hypothetical protein
MTIGIVFVSRCAACVASEPPAKMTSTLAAVSSAARPASLSALPPELLYSTIRFWPSTYPISDRPCRTTLSSERLVVDERMPKRDAGLDCCAGATTGHAATPPTRPINSRRRMVAPKDQNAKCNCPSSTSGRRLGGLSKRNIWRVVMAVVGQIAPDSDRTADIVGGPFSANMRHRGLSHALTNLAAATNGAGSYLGYTSVFRYCATLLRAAECSIFCAVSITNAR